MMYFVILLVLIGFSGIAYATHDPNQPLEHSIILPPDMKESTFEEFMEWCEPFYGEICIALYEKNQTPSVLSPLKQIKSGVALVDVQCSEGKSPAYKYNRMRVACVSEETLVELWNRGWATMRFYTDENRSSHALCNNYQGKWHPEYEGCRDINDLQCSLMGGKFVDGLKICYNEICPVDKTYTLCVTNLDLISGELENEN